MERTVVYRAEWVLPVSAPPVRDGAVLVRGERIAAVGPRAAVEAPPEAEVVELGEAALLPGLVNVHAHPELSAFRGMLEDLPFREWIGRLVRARSAAMREEDYRAAARWTAVEAIRAGMTTVAATESTSAALGAFTEAGLRGIVYHEVFGPAPEQVDASMAGLRAAVERLRSEESDRVRVGISPHAPYSVSDALYRAAAEYARAEGLPMAVHIAESAAEHALVTQGEGDFAPGLNARGIATPRRARSPIELLAGLGVLDARPLLIHCVGVDEADARIIAGHDCAVAHCPVANAKLGHGIAPLAELLAAGVHVGIGTDSVGSNNRLDLLEEARVASLLQRARLRTPQALPPAELLRLCTLEGARALGLDSRIGTLEVGKDADLCAVSLAGAHVRPVHDPVAALFHAARATDVVLTTVAGRELYREGTVRTLDVAAVERGVEEAAERLRRVT